MHTGKMYGQLARAVDLLNVKNQGNGEKAGAMPYTDEMKMRMHYRRHAFRAEITAASGQKMYCRGGDGWLTGKAAYEDLQLEVNPRPFDNPDRPQFRMTNAIAWAIASGELWRIKITSLLGWAWEVPLRLEGTSDIDKHPTEPSTSVSQVTALIHGSEAGTFWRASMARRMGLTPTTTRSQPSTSLCSFTGLGQCFTASWTFPRGCTPSHTTGKPRWASR